VPHGTSDETAPSGAALYLERCASCHGTSATGDGPMSHALRHAPPDLTMLLSLRAYPSDHRRPRRRFARQSRDAGVGRRLQSPGRSDRPGGDEGTHRRHRAPSRIHPTPQGVAKADRVLIEVIMEPRHAHSHRAIADAVSGDRGTDITVRDWMDL